MAKNGSEWAARIKGEVQKSIIGQDVVIERIEKGAVVFSGK